MKLDKLIAALTAVRKEDPVVTMVTAAALLGHFTDNVAAKTDRQVEAAKITTEIMEAFGTVAAEFSSTMRSVVIAHTVAAQPATTYAMPCDYTFESTCTGDIMDHQVVKLSETTYGVAPCGAYTCSEAGETVGKSFGKQLADANGLASK